MGWAHLGASGETEGEGPSRWPATRVGKKALVRSTDPPGELRPVNGDSGNSLSAQRRPTQHAAAPHHRSLGANQNQTPLKR
eukprot:2099085-Alexandrium_andersonii.AAC.1